MTQKEALNIMKTGANVFLTGEPGSGKTHTVNEYVRYLRSCGIEPAITASTGIAATHIGGYTIHSWAGIGIKNFLTEYDLDRISQNERVAKRIAKSKVLIIDEVSMLSAATLDMIDAVCRTIRRPDQAFGGLQVVLVGDFFQLPPISRSFNDDPNARLGFENSRNDSRAQFAYHSDAWANLKPIICYLSEQHRQEDAKFLDILSAIRRGSVSTDHKETLYNRRNLLEPMEGITKLFPHNANVDRINDMELSKIMEDVHTFDMDSKGNPNVVEQLKKSCLSPEKLFLKLGAKVMFTKNSLEKGFVNGTTGVVVDFESYTGAPVIETRSKRRITAEPLEWAVENDGKVLGRVMQVPLRLAWAITVHKSQGMSLDAAVVDLSDAFEYGQGYVALSRVRTLDGLHLLGLNDRALQVHPDTLVRDIEFRDLADQARMRFAEIQSDELEKMHSNFLKVSGGKAPKGRQPAVVASDATMARETKTFDVQEFRKTHANAYKPWSEADDVSLAEHYLEGESLAGMAREFGRNQGAIRARLVKLKLMEDED